MSADRIELMAMNQNLTTIIGILQRMSEQIQETAESMNIIIQKLGKMEEPRVIEIEQRGNLEFPKSRNSEI